MHNALHPKSNVDRFYIPMKEGGTGLQGVTETVNLTSLGLENYVKRVQIAFCYCCEICGY